MEATAGVQAGKEEMGVTEPVFWNNPRFLRTYSTTIEFLASPFAVDVVSLPRSSVDEVELSEVLYGDSRGGRIRTMSSQYPLRASELMSLVTLLFEPGLLARMETVDQAVGQGLEIARGDPNLRRFADAVVTEPLILVEASPARRIALASAVAATSGAIAVTMDSVPALIVSLGAAGLAILKQSTGIQNRVNDLVDPLDTSIAKLRSLAEAGEIPADFAEQQIQELVASWTRRRYQ
jgi:hypothetical protein